MATKRKQDGVNDEHLAKRHPMGYNARAPWLHDTKPTQGWRTLGERAVQPSLPLSNMVSALQDLIDPEFDPLVALLDDEPRFLKPLPSRVAPEDLEFLRFRGALSVPESGLRNELLRCYIQWVHSFLPVLNLQEFLRCIAENDPNGQVSILLFQAVMFVATAFVDLKHLQDAGYATRKNARNAFYTRLRLLYSLDCEEDRIVILQTVLLMTYWSDHENSPQRDIWDWIGVCNTQAHSIGLNRDPSSAANMDTKTKQLRTRLWWSLYTRDRLIALGLRRPTQVNEGTCSVPLLKLEDFDFEPFKPSVLAMLHCRQLEDVSHQKRLATMFIEKVRLCQWTGRVLFAQYAPSQRNFGTTNQTTITLIPRQASESELARCSQKLDSWVNGLPKDAQFIPDSRDNFKEGEDVLLLHSAMLRMLYHATISALYRPWALGTNKDQSHSHLGLSTTARTKMEDAASGITHIIQGLSQLNLTRFLPQSGVTVILPAAVAHLTNTTSENPAVRETSIHNFHRCIQALHRLKDIYPAADMEAANIEAAVRLQAGSEGFTNIMQYNTPNSNPPEPLSRKQSSDSASKPVFPSGQNAEYSTQGGSPNQRRTNSETKHTLDTTPSNRDPPNQEQKPSTGYTETFASPHYSSPFLSTDLFLDPFADFSAGATSLGYQEDIDWTQELLKGTEFNSHPSSGLDHFLDLNTPPKEGDGFMGRSNGAITGDLDRDLGLLHDVD
ncbi:Transcription factor [Aspergillus sclerotialis]|uniref:Transcription factor n=1 Tax=Aspergillus sclerotialis TaxID=2070753 RepID=A0A3A2ZRR0_9EURO|nr:Transcription factor [Aspergillus sclerotialis]